MYWFSVDCFKRFTVLLWLYRHIKTAQSTAYQLIILPLLKCIDINLITDFSCCTGLLKSLFNLFKSKPLTHDQNIYDYQAKQ